MILRFRFAGMPIESLQNPKIWRKNLGPFSISEFSKFERKVEIFGVMGISYMPKKILSMRVGPL